MTVERDLHDASVDKAWRAHMRETPPPALDDAIRAAAHRAVQSAPRSTEAPHRQRHRAWVPLAIAATLGVIAFGVVELAPHEGDTLRDAVSDAPVVAERKQEAAPAPPPRVAQRTDAETRAVTPSPPPPPPPPPSPSQTVPERQALPAVPPAENRAPVPAAAPAPAPAPPPPATDIASAPREVDAGGKLQKEAAADKLAASPAPASRAAAEGAAQTPLAAAPASRDAAVGRAAGTLRAESARAKVATNRTPDDFVREIRRLRAEGRDADAALALAAFRAAYDDADARLPEDLRAWSRSVPRP